MTLFMKKQETQEIILNFNFRRFYDLFTKIKRYLKKNVNTPFIILTVLIFIMSTFLFTTKIYLPDDRKLMHSKNITFNQHTITFDYAFYDKEKNVIEIILSEKIIFENKPLDITSILSIYEQKVKMKNERPTQVIQYIYGQKNITVLYITPSTPHLENIYYFTLLFVQDKELKKMYIDYRKIQNQTIRIRDDDFVMLAQVQEEMKKYERAILEIRTTLQTQQLELIQRQALEIRLQEYQQLLEERKKQYVEALAIYQQNK